MVKIIFAQFKLLKNLFYIIEHLFICYSLLMQLHNISSKKNKSHLKSKL